MRLIDVDALIDKLDIMISEAILADTEIHYVLIRELVAEQPTIDAEPVRHGRLIESIKYNDSHCSECGTVFRDDIRFIFHPDENGFPEPKRCPECGCYWGGGADNG